MVLFSHNKNLTEDTESEAVIAHLLCFLLFSFLSDVFFGFFLIVTFFALLLLPVL